MPSSGGHAGYGASHSSQSGPSGPGPTHDIHVNIDSGPTYVPVAPHDQGYHAHFTSYGTPAESPPASVYIGTSNKGNLRRNTT